MTFAQQIENVPPKLVQQGFRCHPSESLWYRWQETDGVKDPHWQMVRLSDGTKVSRPVYEIAKGVVVYAHAGWGDGLTPTVEMVKIWRYWWVWHGSVLEPALVFEQSSILWWQGPGMGRREIETPSAWRGPCLSPADMP